MTNKAYAKTLKNCASMLTDGIKYMKKEHQKQFKEAYEQAIEELSAEPQEWISPTVEPVSVAEAKKLLYQEFKGKMKDGNPRLLVAYEIAMKALEQTEWISVSSGKFPTSYVAVEVTVIRKDKTWNQTPYIRLAEWHEGLKDWFEIPYPIDQPWGDRLSESDGGDATVVAWRPLGEPYKGDTE